MEIIQVLIRSRIHKRIMGYSFSVYYTAVKMNEPQQGIACVHSDLFLVLLQTTFLGIPCRLTSGYMHPGQSDAQDGGWGVEGRDKSRVFLPLFLCFSGLPPALATSLPLPTRIQLLLWF